ncbi:MAG: ABC transporter ATP-binding protein [Spirochaetes bacterium]|jgi:iron complex transport system ATP-binding protein|nr:ABC transporter ATP-binding protein [Spirochaetota bacterium]
MIELRGVRLPMGAGGPLSFTLETGSITALIGPSGSGKSLLLAAIARRLAAPGDIRIGDRPLARISSREYPLYIAYSDGSVPTDPSGTLGDYLLLARIHLKRFLHPFGEHHVQALDSIVDAFDLGEYRHTPLGALPSDALRRALVACALLRDSELLLLDDPAAGLGIRSLGIVQRALARHTMQGDRTVLFASGDLSFAAQTADRILIMDGGRVAEDLAPEALDADIIRRYFNTEVLVSRNIYNGRPEVHFFPGT